MKAYLQIICLVYLQTTQKFSRMVESIYFKFAWLNDLINWFFLYKKQLAPNGKL